MLTTYLHLKIPCNKFKELCLIIIFGFLFIPSNEIIAQFTFEKSIKTDASFFTIDQFENLYLLESDRIIKIENKTGKRTYYSNPQYGSFDIIDSSDHLNILAFSKDLGIITFMDKNLIEKEPIKIHREGFYEKPDLACNSRLEGFWVYLPDQKLLKRLNRNKQVIASSSNITSLNFGFSQPCFMLEIDSRLYISDKQHGVLAFDSFGSFLFKVPLKDVCTFQIKKNKIIYFSDEYLHVYDFFLKNESLFLLPEKDIKMGYLKHPDLYILTKNGISKYLTDIELF